MGSLIGQASRALMRAPVPLTARFGTGMVNPELMAGMSDAAKLDTFDQSPDVFAVTDRNGETFAAVEWRLYRKRDGRGRVAGGDRREVTSHAALDTLTMPNPFLSGHDLRWLWSATLDLVGKSHWVRVDAPGAGFPVELWPIPPHLMSPVADARRFQVGWVYWGPEGQKIPLRMDQVFYSKRPHPKDPYAASSPIQPLMVDIDAARQAARWNAVYFHNSAQPGGVIEFPEGISDTHWDQFVKRWEESHKGVHNAHRVAVIERGRWVERSTSMRDMEFSQLRETNRQTLLAGFGFPKTMLGQTEDVNRATSQTAREVHADAITLPKLRRFKVLLNRAYLPAFPGGDQLEFDHGDAAPQDQEAMDAHHQSVATTANRLLDAGAEGDQVMEWMAGQGLPEFDFAGRQPVTTTTTRGQVEAHHHPHPQLTARPVVPVLADGDPLPGVDHLQESWERELDALLGDWESAEDDQKAEIVAAVAAILTAQGIDGLDDLDVDSTLTAALLTESMVSIADEASGQVVDEAAEQGVTITKVEPDRDLLGPVAAGVAAILASRLVDSAKATTLRTWSPPGPDDDTAAVIAETVTAVEAGLAALSPATPRSQLGGALTGSQNEGRVVTVAAAEPLGDVFASEVNDTNTCQPCRDIDGTPLGSTADIEQIRQSYPAGGFGGFVDCLGRERCRGTIVIVWRDTQ